MPETLSRLWYMNADFETELAHAGQAYRRLPSFEALNRRLAPHLLWLARAGDALLLPEPYAETLRGEARRHQVELVSTVRAARQPERLFTPWGWTPDAVAAGRAAGAITQPLPFETVARVNSKLWSHALEVELGLALKGAAVASTFEELAEAVARACPKADDKWVVKSPFGFAARERVLGRGPVLEEPQAKWSRRRLHKGEALIFQPWLDVRREYGVVLEISPGGAYRMLGVSDLQTNGAGTGTGYILGRPPAKQTLRELERVAQTVCERL
ncbi:MAG TPA: hypothetical protein VNA19_01250, partial [Pyrinomonadaceae bacterium]|nr:hypothetical protein [Pyrinomonadaceae bacterium]